MVKADKRIVFLKVDDWLFIMTYGADMIFHSADNVFHTGECSKSAKLFQNAYGICHHCSILFGEGDIRNTILRVFVSVVLVLLDYDRGVVSQFV